MGFVEDGPGRASALLGGAVSGIVRRVVPLGCCILVGCASANLGAPPTRDASIPAEQAARLWRQGKIKLIDTRSTNERSSGLVVDALLIQFGPDQWSLGAAEQDSKTFVLLVTEAGLGPADPVVTLCNVGVRSLAAARALRSAGFESVRSVAGGYLGKGADPGWQFHQ